LLSPR